MLTSTCESSGLVRVKVQCAEAHIFHKALHRRLDQGTNQAAHQEEHP